MTIDSDGENPFEEEEGTQDEKQKTKTKEQASFLSRIWFAWIGHKRTLDQQDIHPLAWEDRANMLSHRLSMALEKRKGNLLWAGFDTFKRQILSSLISRVIGECCALVAAFLTQYILRCATEVYHGNTSRFITGLGYIIAVLVLQLTLSILLNQSVYTSEIVGIKAKTTAMVLVYKKAMTISSQGSTRGGFNRGTIMTLAGTHSHELQRSAAQIHILSGQIMAAPIALALLVVNLSYSTFAGIALLLLVLPLQSRKVSKALMSVRREAIAITTKRASLVLSTLGGIRYIKYFAWERMFINEFQKIRWQETRKIRKIHFFNIGTFATFNTLVGLTSLFIFATFRLTGHTFDAPAVFSSMLNLLRENVVSTGTSMYVVGQGYLSLQQIEAFLAADDEAPSAIQYGTSTNLREASFTWEAAEKDKERAFNFRSLNLDFPPAALTVLVGPVAAGKSSLLSAIAGEMRNTSGDFQLIGKRAYCPQTAWIRNASARENILFGSAFDETWYRRVVHACTLEAGFDIFPAGDQTEIDELGINLSGGQKVRINLAQAIYCNADVILLDDPLSAVNAHVGQHIFRHAIRGLLRDKTVILATHQLYVLKESHQVILIQKGDIVFKGPYDYVVNNFDFVAFAGSHPSTIAEVDEQQDQKLARQIKASYTPESYIQEEDRAVSWVKFNVIWDYIKATGSILIVPVVISWYVAGQIFTAFTVNNHFPNLSLSQYIGIYVGLVIWAEMFPYGVGCILQLACTTASNNMTRDALTSVFRAPASFFDTQPLGRIHLRFSTDVSIMDNDGTIGLKSVIEDFASLLGVLALNCIFFPYFTIILIPFYIIATYMIVFAHSSVRELRRISTLHNSHIQPKVQEGISGVTTIRAYNQQEAFTNNIFNDIDILHSSTAGFVLASSINLLYFTRRISWSFESVEYLLHATERIHHYCTAIPHGAALHTDLPLYTNWPEKGQFTFNSISLRYRPDMPLVLQDFTLSISPGQRQQLSLCRALLQTPRL